MAQPELWGPTLPPVWTLVGAADFSGDGKADYLLYNVNTQQTGAVLSEQ
jgi:hypothetical protein